MGRFLTNKERYEGKTVEVYALFNGRLLDKLTVTEVIGNDCLYGTSENSGIETAFYLSDGIRVVVTKAEQ